MCKNSASPIDRSICESSYSWFPRRRFTLIVEHIKRVKCFPLLLPSEGILYKHLGLLDNLQESLDAMDPLTSLSLATSIIQIADFGCKLTKKGYQIFKKGSTDSNDEIEQIAEGIKDLTLALSTSLTTASQASTTNALRQEEMVSHIPEGLPVIMT